MIEVKCDKCHKQVNEYINIIHYMSKSTNPLHGGRPMPVITGQMCVDCFFGEEKK